MPFFQYTAIDANDTQLSGNVEALTPEEARRLLQVRGFQKVRLEPRGTSSPPRVRQGVQQQPARPAFIRTRRATDQQLMFCFTQVASLIRTGFNPFEAFGMVVAEMQNPALRRACEDIASQAKEGKSPSSVMELYVDVFPHNVVGMVRAGEHGGFVPESLDYLGQHFAESSAFKKWFWLLRAITWQSIVAVIFAVPLPQAFWASFHAVSENFQVFKDSYIQFLLHPTLTVSAAVLILWWIFYRIWRSHALVRVRHGLVLRLPRGLGGRARVESLRAFLWTLRNLASAGVPASTAWPLAAASAPNAEYAMRLADAGRLLGQERPLSAALVQARLFPHDYGPLLQRAEDAGDIVGALDRMVTMTNEEYEIGKTATRAGLGATSCLLMVLGSGILMIMLAKGCYSRLIEETSEESIRQER
ncbi:MAG: type II secretion system F family protein [Armatimonadetes bacterium]|nr:type II secretion system F family protein [Armatimonadota bacterium]